MEIFAKGTFVDVTLQPSKHKVPAMVLGRRFEAGMIHYFCQVLDERECYTDVIHYDDSELYSTLTLKVNYNPFGTMEDIAAYMGYKI